MSHMQPQTYEGDYFEVEADGTMFLPAEVCGIPDAWPRDSDNTPSATMLDLDSKNVDPDCEDTYNLRDTFGDYVEGGPDRITSATYVPNGTLYRLSAPGYMDCTEWSPEPIDYEEG